MSTAINVGYIGLGNIGKPSAQRLIGDAYKAHVYDVFAPAVEELVAAGAVGCASVAELASACRHIGICVRDDAQAALCLFDHFLPDSSCVVRVLSSVLRLTLS